MGLDMYLERYPRYKDFGPTDISNFEAWLEWKDDPEAQKHSFYEWCGGDENKLPNAKDGKYLAQFYSTKFYFWDSEHHYPHDRIYDQVAYWRKANAIHKWFVENVQGGVDDCDYHNEVTKATLEKLIDICKEVLENAVLVKGLIKDGYSFQNGKEVPNYVEGYKVADPTVCEELLPTTDGFFFGGTEYNQWYIDDVRETYEMLSKVIEETDFEKQMIFYRSSW